MPFRRLPTPASFIKPTMLLITARSNSSSSLPSQMSAWQCVKFANNADVSRELYLTRTRRLPTLTGPNQLLVKVEAASVNPIDHLILQGYGDSSFNATRQLGHYLGLFGLTSSTGSDCNGSSTFPLTPGRDFVGRLVASTLTTGRWPVDALIAGSSLPFQSSIGAGSMAEYVTCPASYCALVPEPDQNESNTSYLASVTALGYAGLTAWSALVNAGGMRPSHQHDAPRVLIVGATGGVGMMASQLAQLWGARVSVISRSDPKAIDMVNQWSVEQIITDSDHHPSTPIDHYDLIIDCLRSSKLAQPSTTSSNSLWSDVVDLRFQPDRDAPYLGWLNSHPSSRYVLLNTPLLHLTDRFGPLVGSAAALGELVQSQFASYSSTSSSTGGSCGLTRLRWAFFQPDGNRLTRLVDWFVQGRLKVHLDTLYSFDQVPEALDRIGQSGLRGKLVVRVANDGCDQH